MAASGYTPISLYYSTTLGLAPTNTNLVYGELAINIRDGKLYYKDNNNVVQVIAGTGGTGVVAGSNTQVQFNNNGVFGASSAFTWDGTTLSATKVAGAFNGTLGATTPNTVAATSLTVTGVVTANTTTNNQSYTTTGAGVITIASGTTGTIDNFNIGGTTAGTGKFTSVTDTGLTSGRVTLASTGGLLADSANLTFNGTTLAITGNLTATADSTFSSTGALTISKGTTGQQPGSPVVGMMRYNTTTNQFEGYSGASPAWKSIGGSALSNDTSTATFEYPVFASATTGTAENLYTSNAKYLYKPSTGELQSESFMAGNGIICNSQAIATSYTLPTGYNGLSAGPVTVNSGVTVTVPSGATWVIA